MQIGMTHPWWQPLAEALCSGAPAVVVGGPAVSLWDKVNAFSTLAVAALAVIEVWRARKEGKARVRAADARVAAIAYALHRQVESWLALITFDDTALGLGLLEYQQWMAEIQRHFPAAEARLTDLAERSAEASKTASDFISRAYVRFYSAADVVNEYLRISKPARAYTDAKEAYRLLSKSKDDLWKCVTPQLIDAVMQLLI
jgi:hypothetical protein